MDDSSVPTGWISCRSCGWVWSCSMLMLIFWQWPLAVIVLWDCVGSSSCTKVTASSGCSWRMVVHMICFPTAEYPGYPGQYLLHRLVAQWLLFHPQADILIILSLGWCLQHVDADILAGTNRSYSHGRLWDLLTIPDKPPDSSVCSCGVVGGDDVALPTGFMFMPSLSGLQGYISCRMILKSNSGFCLLSDESQADMEKH